MSGYAETIIDRNAQIPVEQTRRFSTSQNQQSSVRIQVCQGESRIFDENQALGELVLENLRPAQRGEVKIDVTFEINTDGILQVQAVDLDTGQKQRARVKVLGTLSEEEVAKLAAKQDNLPAASS